MSGPSVPIFSSTIDNSWSRGDQVDRRISDSRAFEYIGSASALRMKTRETRKIQSPRSDRVVWFACAALAIFASERSGEVRHC